MNENVIECDEKYVGQTYDHFKYRRSEKSSVDEQVIEKQHSINKNNDR